MAAMRCFGSGTSSLPSLALLILSFYVTTAWVGVAHTTDPVVTGGEVRAKARLAVAHWASGAVSRERRSLVASIISSVSGVVGVSRFYCVTAARIGEAGHTSMGRHDLLSWWIDLRSCNRYFRLGSLAVVDLVVAFYTWSDVSAH